MTSTIGCHVMAKPSGSVCNIDCEYCFYLEKEMLYPERQANWRMSDETLQAFIKQHIEAQPNNTVEFAWQGGEPTLLGIEFYQKVVSLCEKYRGNKTINHAFQTNGILLNDQWCQFFKKHHFLIGISIDGPEDLHDRYRVTRSKKGTHASVLAAVNLLKKHHIEFNTLTVVNAENVKHPLRVYQFLKSIGSTFLQFIPLVERTTQTSHNDTHLLAGPSDSLAKVTPWSVDPKEYGQFLTTIFDYWVRHDVGSTFVQMFDSTLASWTGNASGICIFSKQCGHVLALESNGDLYQCDHYVYPEYKLGNIHSSDISTLNNSDKAIQFGVDKFTTLNDKCRECRYQFACFGGCPKHRFERGPSGKPDHNYLCSGYFDFFRHSEKAMQVMAQLLRQRRPAAEIMAYYAIQDNDTGKPEPSIRIGRNEPCPCGSGKKFKKCCG
ncbi:anaerobic sulfatase maturase [Vibrio sp. MA40-2]|uniref:anaerobic sulfatase maturase n=1 Tax=Vibrio sp. MA40-2 TaxID=3391828 RepID=UPI0039A6BEBB